MKQLIELIENLDVTNILGITQYIAPDPTTLGNIDAKGKITDVGILITDEERIENLQNKYQKLREFKYYKTEKLEGTSVTYYLKNGEFGVCGRTINFQIPDENIPFDKLNAYWKVAKKYDIEQKMRAFALENNINAFAIQGEIVGESIQGNIYKIRGQEVCFYYAFDIKKQEYFEYDLFIRSIQHMGLQTVPIINTNYEIPKYLNDLLSEADEATTVFGNNKNQLVEGFVYIAKGNLPKFIKIARSDYGKLSFKVKSRTYDIKKSKI